MERKKTKEVKLEYQGLIISRCKDCNRTLIIFSKDKVSKITCRFCNSTFFLDTEPKSVIATCECGYKTKAVTNCDTPILEFNCKCGYPITAEYYHKKHRYLGIR